MPKFTRRGGGILWTMVEVDYLKMSRTQATDSVEHLQATWDPTW